MQTTLSLSIVIVLVLALMYILYSELGITPLAQKYQIFPGNAPSTNLACPVFVYGEHSSLINSSNASKYNVSGYSDYVFSAGSTGLLGFNVSNLRIAGYNGSTITINNSLTFYHAENGTLVNYSTGSTTSSCDEYSNGTTKCSGTMPVACYLGSSGEVTCQTEYEACIGTITGIAYPNSSTQNRLLTNYNYTCNTSYVPPQNIVLHLETHPGINVSIMPKNETLAYGEEATGLIELSISQLAPLGTYLVALNPNFCAGNGYLLLTVGTVPYNGTINTPLRPL